MRGKNVKKTMTSHQQTLIEQAIRYTKLGFSLIPVGNEKSDVLLPWKRYQTALASLGEIKSWISRWPTMNLGVVTGEISGIVVVDIEKGGSTKGYPATATAKSGRDGRHLYYRHPGYPIKNSVRIAELTDIRGDGGYVVLPPSVLSENRAYEWIVSPEDAGGFADMPTLPGQNPKSTLVENHLEVIPKGSRNSSATQEVGRILHSLSPKDWETYGWSGLRTWNERYCSPPLEENELRAVYDSITSRERERRTTDHKRDPETEEVAPFKVFTLSDLYEEELPEAQWIVKDLVPLGGITAFTGESNSFKSFLTLALAASVAEQRDYLDHFPTTKGKVLIVDEENNRGTIRKRFEDMRIEPSEDILFVSQGGFRADTKASIEALKAVIAEHKPVLIILDSLIDIHTKNENDAPEMNSIFLAIKHELLTPESSVIVIHHHRKPQVGQASRPGQNMRGSSGIYAALDSHISIHRRKDTEIIITQDKLRIQKQLDPFKVALVLADTNDGSVAFTYQGVDNTKETVILEAQNAALRELQSSTDPMTIKELVVATNQTEPNVRAAMAGLVDNGEVIRTKGPHNTSLYILPQVDAQPPVEEPLDLVN